jgi:hypothetical protein
MKKKIINEKKGSERKKNKIAIELKLKKKHKKDIEKIKKEMKLSDFIKKAIKIYKENPKIFASKKEKDQLEREEPKGENDKFAKEENEINIENITNGSIFDKDKGYFVEDTESFSDVLFIDLNFYSNIYKDFPGDIAVAIRKNDFKKFTKWTNDDYEIINLKKNDLLFSFEYNQKALIVDVISKLKKFNLESDISNVIWRKIDDSQIEKLKENGKNVYKYGKIYGYYEFILNSIILIIHDK